ncbi:MAG: acyl carrier protein [Candidatus Sericytochromatia bacterium]
MSDDAVRETVFKTLELVLQRPVGREGNPSRLSEEGWDSLKQVELLFAIEDAFGIQFDEAEMDELRSVDEIVASLEKHGAAPRR